MTDPRTSTALHHFPLAGPPPPRWLSAVATPDPTGRVRLPAAALEALGAGPAHAWIADGLPVLSHVNGPGRPIGNDQRGRCYLPA